MIQPIRNGKEEIVLCSVKDTVHLLYMSHCRCWDSSKKPILTALGAWEVYCKDIQTVSAELGLVSETTVTVEADKARQVMGLMEALEEHDDVQNVYANFDIPDEIMAEVEKGD